jgi:hypothetical protein
MPIAATAKPARQAAAPLCAAVPYDLRRAGEREAFIFGASISLFWKRHYSKTGFPPPHENSNNPLAAEPESENDASRFFLKDTFKISLRLKRRLPATARDLFK